MAEQKTPADAGTAAAPADNETNPDTDAANLVLDDLAKLRARAAERDQFLDLLQRTQADFQNYQKRTNREREQERRYLVGELARSFLPVIDNLERAIAHARKVGETGQLVDGVSRVQSQLLDVLRRNGIVPIEAVGQPFDPNRHQAVMQRPSADFPPNTVLEVLEQGFTIHDRVLRPASVVVSTPAGGGPKT